MSREGFFRRFFSSPVAVALSVLLLVVLLIGWITNILPWWLVLAILAAVVIGFVLYGLWRNWQARRAEAGIIEGLKGQDETHAKSGKRIDKGAVEDMQRRWMKGFETLRKRVGRGRAVYDLPWFVIIGNPATGKTSAIRHSRLRFADELDEEHSTHDRERGMKGFGGTRNCDWFFAEEAVLLDTAGRWTRGGEATDREEWRSFLRLLRKYRRDMPINGVLIAVAADELLRPDAHPGEEAKRMRSRLSELIEELQVQFPVFVLVTKCDLVQGFADFFRRQPRERLEELLGWTNPSWEMDDFQRRLETSLEHLREQVTALRPSMMRDEEDPAALRNIFVFPDKLRLLTKSLVEYVDGLFHASRFSDSAFLRGVYFTSALQTGSTIDDLVKGMGVRVEPIKDSKSYFLDEFFQERLRQDSRLVVPTGRATIRMRLANNVSLLAVAVACLTIAGLATKSYVENRTTLNRVVKSIDGAVGFKQKSAAEQGELLNGYWSDVEWLRDKAQHPTLVERWGLFKGEAALAPVERAFISSYETAAHRPALERASATLIDYDDPTRSIPALEALIAYLVETNQAREHDLKSGGELLADYWPGGGDGQAKQNFASAYRFYIRDPWRLEDEMRRQALLAERTDQLHKVQTALPELLKLRTIRTWVGDKTAPAPLPKQVTTDVALSSAFTPDAWKDQISPLVEKVNEIRPELEGYSTDPFVRAYATAYYGQWRQVLTSFRPGASDLAGLCEDPSDYVEAFARVQAMVKDPIDGVDAPAWTRSLARITAKQQEYTDTIEQTCRKAGGGDPCVPWRKWSEEGGSPFEHPRVLVDAMCKGEGDDADAGEVGDECRRFLLKPVEAVAEETRRACSRRLEQEFLEGVRKPSTVSEACPVYAEPSGSAWATCKELLAPFYDCTAIASRPGSPIAITPSVGTVLQRAREVDKLLCGGNPGGGGGGSMAYPMRFESLPSDSRTGVRVTETTLAIRCPNQDLDLTHHNDRVKGSLQWSTACGEAELRLTLGTPSGGPVGSVELRRSGPLSVPRLLGAAQRVGDEYTWDFKEKGVSASFKVSVDPKVLKLATLFAGE